MTTFTGHHLQAAVAACWVCVATASLASGGDVPFVRLCEERGHLNMVSNVPAGKMECAAVDDQGLKLSGFVLVEGEGDAKRVRLFRLKGTSADTDGQTVSGADATRIRAFSVVLQGTSNPDHYLLHLKIARIEDGKVIEDEARLGRNCCGYYVSASKSGEPLPAGRAPLLTDLMVAAADTYAQFERVAEMCGRPGFELVPASQFSPSIVGEVVATDQSRPTEAMAKRFRELVMQLDSEQFAEREAASVELVRGGRSTLWSLDHAEGKGLSTEQRQRLKRVRSALAEFSTPKLPFEFNVERIRELSDSPSTEWLTQLRSCSDRHVSDWARLKLSFVTTDSSAENLRAKPDLGR